MQGSSFTTYKKFTTFDNVFVDIILSSSQAYLHQLIAHPAEVSPFSGFLPQQVLCVAAETVLTIQTQRHPTHGQDMKEKFK